MPTFILDPLRVIRAQLDIRDGEDLQITAVRNGVTGELAIAIAPTMFGQKEPLDEASLEKAFDGDSVTLTNEEMKDLAEGRWYFFTLWAEDGNKVMAEGAFRKSPAIRFSKKYLEPEDTEDETPPNPQPEFLSALVLPAITGTPKVGETLTSDTGTWTGTAPIAYAYQWQRDGVNIAGATAETYVLQAADDETAVRCVVTATNGVGSASATSAAVSVTYPAATVTGTLDDVTLTFGGGNATVDASAAFSGAAGGAWSVTVAGLDQPAIATIDGAGLVTILDDTEMVGAAIVVAHTNSGGSASVSFTATVAQPAAPTATGALADLTLTQGAAMTPVDLSNDFTGTGLTFALAPSSAALPTGLILTSAGVLSGTPTALATTASIVIRATDTVGQTVESGFSLTVEAAASIIDWTPPTLSQTNMTIGANSTIGQSEQTGDMLAFTDKTRTNLILVNEAPDPASVGVTLDQNFYYLRSTSTFSGSKAYTVRGPSAEVIALGLEGYTGNHKLLWQGVGDIRRNDAPLASSATADVVTLVDAVSGDTEKFYVTDCNFIGDLRLNVFGMDESQALDADPDAMAFDVGHIRNLRLIHETRVTTEAGAGLDGTDRMSAPLLDPLFVHEIAQLGAYRDMGWNGTNQYEQDDGTFFGPTDGQVPLKASTWNPVNGRGGDRDPTPGNGMQVPLVGRMPYAARIAALKEIDAYWLANIQPLGANRRRPVWYFNLPMDINDAAMIDFAQQLTTLPVGVQVRVEIGNELWNAKVGYNTYGYCKFMGSAVAIPETSQAQGYYAHRVSELFTLLFTSQPSLIGVVIPIAGANGANIDHINGVLDADVQALYGASTPLETVLTTYSGEIVIGAYAGLDDTSATLPILQELVLDNTAFVTLDERAEAMYRFFMFGTTENRRYDVARGGPVVTGMVYDENTAINLAPLIWDGGALEAEFKDAQTIHVRKNRFLELFQLVGSDIQFRAAPGNAWATVASFDTAPSDTLEQMFDKMRITASGGIIWGTLYPLSIGTVYAKTAQALKHTAVRDATGIPLSVYEFGNFMDNAPPNDNGLYRFFLFDSPYAARIIEEMARRFDAAGLKAAHYYTSHQRFYDQEWGACLYTGHWANATDKWREVPRFDLLVKWNEAYAALAQPNADTVTLAALPRDQAMFDATDGPAAVPISGTTTAADGATIEARAVDVDGGTDTTAWRDVGTASGGAWSGTLTTPLATSWLRVEARVKGSSEAAAQSVERFGTGHVIAFLGQSEMQRFTLSSFNGSGVGLTVTDEGNLQVYWSENEDGADLWGTPNRLRGGPVTNATQQSVHARALSNALAAAYPGRKFSIAIHARGGTSRGQSASPDATERNFPGELAIRDLAFPIPEMRPGITYESWFFNDMFNVSTGQELVDQRIIPYAIGQKPDGTAGGFPVSIYPDLYDSAQSVHGIALHRYDAQGDTTVKMGQARQALADYFESNPNRPAWLRRGTDALTYQNKSTDWAHPNTDTAGGAYLNGMVRYFTELVAGALRVGGVTTWEQPEFTNSALATDSTYVEVWSDAGDVTTYRNILSETPPTGYPEVWGFRHNDVRTAADIVAGRVRVYPVGGGTFADGDKITFASDGAGAADPIDGTSTGIEDNLTAEIWKDHPVVDLGANNPPLLDAVPVRAATPASVLAVIPDAVLEPDDNTNPNLATASAGAENDNFINFVSNGGGTATGWKGSGWTFNGDGTATVGTGSGDGYVRPSAYLGGMMLELSFVVRTPNNATGTMLVSPRSQKFGGSTTYFGTQEVTVANDVRYTLIFDNPHPSVVDIFQVKITPTISGTVTISDITIKEVEAVAPPADATAPTLTGMTGTSTGETTASWSVTSDEAGGTIFAAIRLASENQLLASQIEPGTGNAIATSTDTTPTADGNNGGTFTGLTAGTEYRVDAFHRDAAGNQSPVVPSEAFITDAVPVGNTNPNLATQAAGAENDNFINFVSNGGSGTATGWKGSGWTFNTGGGAKAVVGAGTTTSADGYVRPPSALFGKDLEMSFLINTPDNATGTITSSPRSQKFSGSITYYGTEDVPVANNTVYTKVFNITHAADGDIFWLKLTPSGLTGTVEISDITVREVVGGVVTPTLTATAAGGVGTFDATVTPSDDTVAVTYDVVDAGGVSVGSGTISTGNLTAGQPTSIAQITGLQAEDHTVTFTQGAVTGTATATVESADPVDPPAPGSFVGQGRFTTGQVSGMNFRTHTQASPYGSGSALVEGATFAGPKATDLWISLNEHDPKPYDDPNTARFTHVAHVAKASGDSWQTAVKVNPAMPAPEKSDHGAMSVIWDAPRSRYLQLTTNHNNPFFEMVTAPSPVGPWTVTNIKPAIDAAVLDLMPGEPNFSLKYSYARPFVMSDGSILATFRKMAVGGDRLIARSIDGGLNWGEAQIVNRGSRPYTWGVPHPDNRVLHIFTQRGGPDEHEGPGSNSGIYHLIVNPSNMSTAYTMDGGTEAWNQEPDDFGPAGIVSRVQPYDFAWTQRGMVEDDGSTFGRPACTFLRYPKKVDNGIWKDESDADVVQVWWARWTGTAWQDELVEQINLTANVRSALADIDPFNSNNVIYNVNGTLRKAVWNGSTWTKSTITTGLGVDGRPFFDRIRTAGPRVWARKSGAWQLFSF